MTHDPTLSRLLASVNAATLARHLQWFSGVPRDTGGAGEDQAAAYLAAELEAAGVPVTMHEFDAFLSYPRDATFRTVTPSARDFRCVTHSFVRSTGPEGITADLVAVHRLADRLQPRHGGSVDGACTSSRAGKGGPKLGGGLDDLAPGPQHRLRVLAGGVHEDLSGGEVGIQE